VLLVVRTSQRYTNLSSITQRESQFQGYIAAQKGEIKMLSFIVTAPCPCDEHKDLPPAPAVVFLVLTPSDTHLQKTKDIISLVRSEEEGEERLHEEIDMGGQQTNVFIKSVMAELKAQRTAARIMNMLGGDPSMEKMFSEIFPEIFPQEKEPEPSPEPSPNPDDYPTKGDLIQ